MDYLVFDKIIKYTKNDNKFPIKYLLNLFNYHNDFISLPININTPLAAIKCFIPLPTNFQIIEYNKNKIKKENNDYNVYIKPINFTLMGDKFLPCKETKSPIPFSFPVYNDTNVEILISNVYYYEVTLTSNKNIDGWLNEVISIGYSSNKVITNAHIGNIFGSFGFFSSTGNIRYNNNIMHNTHINYKAGDTIGAGIIYITENQIKPFFTYNEKLIYIYDKTIDILLPYFPAIGYYYSNSIHVNFSTSKFKFDIKNIISKYSNNIISTDNLFIETNNISQYINIILMKSRLKLINLIPTNITIPTSNFFN